MQIPKMLSSQTETVNLNIQVGHTQQESESLIIHLSMQKSTPKLLGSAETAIDCIAVGCLLI